MNIIEILSQAAAKLKKTGNQTAALDAEVLLAFILNKPKEYLYTYPEKKLTASQVKRYTQVISRRLKGEPIAYIRGFKEFYGLEFFVDKNVLIPRSETELLVEQAGKLVSRQAGKLTVADIGTGSGAIAVTLAKLLPRVKICATDISAKALAVAKKNAKKHNVKIEFYQGNLLEPVRNIKIDILAANLPYGDKNSWSRVKNSDTVGLKFEPKIALYAKNSGLGLYQNLFKQIAVLKFLPKHILIEIDPSQTKKAEILAKKFLPNYSLQIKKDLSGQNRLLLISNP